MLIEALGRLPAGVQKVMLRSDTAGYQRELLRYCAEGRDERFGVIEFAVGVDVTAEFRRAVSEVAEQDWQTLYRKVGEHRVDTGQQWADVNFVPNWIGHSKNSPEYRFIATRERLIEQPLPGMEGQVLGGQWVGKRLKAVRFALIALPGRVMRHARRLIIRLARGHPSYELLLRARQRILALAAEPYRT